MWRYPLHLVGVIAAVVLLVEALVGLAAPATYCLSGHCVSINGGARSAGRGPREFSANGCAMK